MEEKTCPDFVKPTKRACPTKFLFVSNANTDSETIQLDLMNLFQQFGEFDETFGPIFISKEKVIHPFSLVSRFSSLSFSIPFPIPFLCVHSISVTFVTKTNSPHKLRLNILMKIIYLLMEEKFQ
jgi:hypothetical protein